MGGICRLDGWGDGLDWRSGIHISSLKDGVFCKCIYSILLALDAGLSWSN